MELFLESSTVEDLKGTVEMNDEEFRKALFEFLEHIQDHTLRNSLSSFVRGIYRKNGEALQDLNDNELKSALFHYLKDKRYLLVMDDIGKLKYGMR